MGDPSYVEDQEIELDKSKLEKFNKWLEDNKDEQYVGQITLIEGNCIEIELDDFKIVQYWYKEFLEFLEEVAKFIKYGYINLDCPGYSERAEIKFEDGKVWLNLQGAELFSRCELKDVR